MEKLCCIPYTKDAWICLAIFSQIVSIYAKVNHGLWVRSIHVLPCFRNKPWGKNTKLKKKKIPQNKNQREKNKLYFLIANDIKPVKENLPDIQERVNE